MNARQSGLFISYAFAENFHDCKMGACPGLATASFDIKQDVFVKH